VGAGAIGNVSEDLGPVLELNPVDAIGKRLHHDPLHDRGTLGHERRLYQTGGSQFEAPFVPGSDRPPVRIKGPLSVIATVCSK
jgi:hypothetical protein